MIVRNLTFLLLMLSVFISCKEVRKLTESISNTSAREMYRRELKSQPEWLAIWDSNYVSALKDSLDIQLPYGEKGNFSFTEKVAYSYNFSLHPGKRLIAEIQSDSLGNRIFLDLLQYNGVNLEIVESSAKGQSTLTFSTEVPLDFKLIVEPEVNAAGSFYLSVYEEPMYAFPVAGKGNASIQSYWGNARDGGKRNHEGIDIFAPKGWPVVAVADGRIGFTGEKGMGGKQVWLRATGSNHSIYYAHLDSIMIATGTTVQQGDTLGTVGNTGNAITTPPHLHFGIYRGYGGAVDPLPYVYQLPTIEPSQFPKNFDAPFVKINASKANLRKAPNNQSKMVGSLARTDTILLLGQSKDWLHIQTAMGQKAFLHKSLVKKI